MCQFSTKNLIRYPFSKENIEKFWSQKSASFLNPQNPYDNFPPLKTYSIKNVNCKKWVKDDATTITTNRPDIFQKDFL